MPSSEKIISPGVFTNEIDQSHLPAAIGEIGAALIGPTVKGAAGIPTVVNSYSEYQVKFGDTFRSGSDYYQYLTSYTAKEYLKHGSKLTVVRILDGAYGGASATVLTGSGNYFTGSAAAGDRENTGNTSFKLNTLADGLILNNKDLGADVTAAAATATITITSHVTLDGTVTITDYAGTTVVYTAKATEALGDNEFDGDTGGDSAVAASLVDCINNASGHNGTIVASTTTVPAGQELTLTQNAVGPTGNTPITLTSLGGNISKTDFSGGTTDPVGASNILTSGSKDNLRWEISSTNPKKGSFTLLIRRGDDNNKRKQTLESWNNLSLDENSSNYIGKIIGNQVWTLRGSGGTDPYLQLSGSYPNKSKYVRVSNVANTTDYLDENGNVRVPAASASMPGLGSGSFAGAFSGGTDGTVQHPKNFYQAITDANSQGLILTSATEYEDAINLLGNQDEYDINLVLMPGVTDGGTGGSSLITKAVDMCEDRGDCFVIADPGLYNQALTTAATKAEARDSSYAAMYYPWIQIGDSDLGKNVWVPPSTVMAGVYAFNDKISHPWFAPAGLNRGTIDMAIQAERKLTHSNRDTLYESNVNPIATFPGQGVTVWGQKTLQKKASALDRINVRRLLIKVKKFIAASSRFLVFEQNTNALRKRFLSIANPFLEQVQSNSGLNAFSVVMDASNNTPDVVDRNILYGQIFLQPTRTAEFIVLDFTVQPTGATFPE